jgi:peptide/nickel transport system substrate-binding protein
VLTALGKPSSNVPFMMPKRVAGHRSQHADLRLHGLGPVRVQEGRVEAGRQVVYVKWDKYKPRSEPVSGLAGGKVAKVDRVEWRQLADQQTAVNALIAGEIDFIEQPSHDLLPVLRKDSNIKLVDWNPLGNQYAFRFNATAKPFDNREDAPGRRPRAEPGDFLQA